MVLECDQRVRLRTEPLESLRLRLVKEKEMEKEDNEDHSTSSEEKKESEMNFCPTLWVVGEWPF
jgi:hypothetical protein